MVNVKEHLRGRERDPEDVLFESEKIRAIENSPENDSPIYKRLKKELGREPTAMEIADLKITHQDKKAFWVNELVKELKKPADQRDPNALKFFRQQIIYHGRWKPIYKVVPNKK